MCLPMYVIVFPLSCWSLLFCAVMVMVMCFGGIQDDVVDSIRDLYGNIDREDVFTYEFKDASTDITIELDGVKQELGQTLDSTGLTIWRAAEHLSHFIFHNRHIFAGKVVAELGAGLG